MTDFSKRIVGGTSLGAGLAACREEAGITRTELSRRTRVSERYLAAFEEDDYGSLPEPAYQRAFLRSVAAALGIEEGPLLERHALELGQALGVRTRPHLPPRAASRFAFLVAPRVASVAGVVAVALLALGALGFEVWRIVTPPALTLTSPTDGMIATGPSVEVAGTAEREAELRVNGEPVFLRPDGSFSEILQLRRGVNLIKIAAKKPHSDERVLYRRVIWGSPEDAGGGEAPPVVTR